MINSQGSYRVTNENQMKAYDNLPPSARRALQDSAFNWACPPLVTHWRKGARGYKTGKDIAATLAQAEAKRHAKDVRRGLVAPR
jgi:hypothetical protein